MISAFDITGLRSFADALGGLTGRPVRVELRGDEAYTDGDLIVLPTDGPWRGAPFRVLCGAASHEYAHVWFDSLARFRTFLGRYTATEAARVRRAANTVFDVADETRFVTAMPAAEALFSAVRGHLLRAAISAGRLPTAPPPAVPEDHFLVAVIMWVRSAPDGEVRRVYADWVARVPGLADAVRIVERAVERPTRGAFNPMRSRANWDRLWRLVTDLKKLLDRLYPRSHDPQPQQPDERPAAGGAPEATDAMAEWARGLAGPPALPDPSAASGRGRGRSVGLPAPGGLGQHPGHQGDARRWRWWATRCTATANTPG